ncbi:MAG: T9SS type A sorting domain-containing protein, partial [Bacteroidetes bacterium]|nr:T9SS type A sorting domain-containing protein [Bacteroidota bacterium]
HQKHGNDIGTYISNRAGIIFDYNQPVITNSVWNVVWELPIVVSIPEILNNPSDVVINVYPNPSNTLVTFELIDYSAKEPYRFELFDSFGKEVSSIFNLQENKFQISTDILRKGIYHYRIHNNDNIIGKGKLVVY